jgi:hypothetical protein
VIPDDNVSKVAIEVIDAASHQRKVRPHVNVDGALKEELWRHGVVESLEIMKEDGWIVLLGTL